MFPVILDFVFFTGGKNDCIGNTIEVNPTDLNDLFLKKIIPDEPSVVRRAIRPGLQAAGNVDADLNRGAGLDGRYQRSVLDTLIARAAAKAVERVRFAP